MYECFQFQLEISYSSGNIMTLVLIILISQIAYKEPLIQGKIMILLLIPIIPQITHKDNNMRILLIAVMPQITQKEFISFYFSSILLSSIDASQESVVGTVENISTLGNCLIYN